MGSTQSIFEKPGSVDGRSDQPYYAPFGMPMDTGGALVCLPHIKGERSIESQLGAELNAVGHELQALRSLTASSQGNEGDDAGHTPSELATHINGLIKDDSEHEVIEVLKVADVLLEVIPGGYGAVDGAYEAVDSGLPGLDEAELDQLLPPEQDLDTFLSRGDVVKGIVKISDIDGDSRIERNEMGGLMDELQTHRDALSSVLGSVLWRGEVEVGYTPATVRKGEMNNNITASSQGNGGNGTDHPPSDVAIRINGLIKDDPEHEAVEVLMDADVLLDVIPGSYGAIDVAYKALDSGSPGLDEAELDQLLPPEQDLDTFLYRGDVVKGIIKIADIDGDSRVEQNEMGDLMDELQTHRDAEFSYRQLEEVMWRSGNVLPDEQQHRRA